MTPKTIQFRQHMLSTVYTYLRDDAVYHDTEDYLTFINKKARRVEEDMFHSASSLQGYYTSDEDKIREVTMKFRICSNQNFEKSELSSTFTSSLSDTIFHKNVLQVRKTDFIGKTATVPEICFLLLQLQWQQYITPSGTKKLFCNGTGDYIDYGQHRQERITEEVLSKDMILYITEFLPMSKYKFFKLYVNPFLRLSIPEKLLENLYNFLMVLRERHDIPYTIYSSESFCNEIKKVATCSTDSSFQQSADILNKKTFILYHLSTYLCPLSSQAMMNSMQEALEKNVILRNADHHLLSGILRNAGNSLHTPWPLTLRQMETAMATRVFGFKEQHELFWNPFHKWFRNFLTVLKKKT
jgi:hypothetical protein